MSKCGSKNTMSRRSLLSAGGCAGISLALPNAMTGCSRGPVQPYTPKMELAPAEKSLLAGEGGPTMQRIMTTLTEYGDIYGASRFVDLDGPIHTVASFSLFLLGPMFDIVDQLKREGFKTKVPFSANPRPTDYENVSVGIAERAMFSTMFPGQAGFENDLQALGMRRDKAFSCGAYQPEVGNVPKRGDILCWSESSAVSFANSVLAARSNRNSGIMDFFCGIIGKTPYFGLLTDEGRRANWLVDVKTSSPPDPWLLGAAIGGAVVDGVPYIRGLGQYFCNEPGEAFKSWAKDFGAAGASNGAIGLYHLDGITPEARDFGESLVQAGARTLVVDDSLMELTLRSFGAMTGRPDLCVIGCPHNSLEQLHSWTERITKALQDAGRRQVAVPTILTAAPQTITKFKQSSEWGRLSATGAQLGSMCALMHCQNPLIGARRVLTNSAKLRHYSKAKFAPGPAILRAVANGVIA